MGAPSIDITFRTLGITAVKRSEKGVVAVIVKDSTANGGHNLYGAADIPAGLGAENKAHVERAFTGYINRPRQVVLYVIGDAETLEDALGYLATQRFDYLTAAPDIDAQDARKIVDWVKSERQNHHMVKAVLPSLAADSEAIVNFTAADIKAGNVPYTTAEYCSRIAGLIAGTPMTIACTYAPLPELTDVKRLSKAELDAAIDRGEFVLLHDGEKVKVASGVNSFSTTVEGKGDAFKTIKLVEAMDMIQSDIRITADDGYIGKYANSYDNKCLLLVAIKGYFEELERAGILAKGTSQVEINLEAQRGYLKANGTDISKLTDQQIKEANTGKKVFLMAKVSILDAIEDIELPIEI